MDRKMIKIEKQEQASGDGWKGKILLDAAIKMCYLIHEMPPKGLQKSTDESVYSMKQIWNQSDLDLKKRGMSG